MKISKKQIEQICKKLNVKLINYSYLASGNHNEIYLIKTTNKNYVMKIGEDSNRLNEEFKTIKTLKKGLGPKVYIFDNTHKIISKTFFIEEFLKGKHPPKKPDDLFFIEIAKWYKNLHSIKSVKIDSKEKKIFYSLTYWINHHFDKCKKDKNQIGKLLYRDINNFFKEVNKICKQNNNLFKKRKRFSLNQNDPSEENIFVTKEGVKVIDWEFSGYGLYERDLILFLERYKPTKKQEDLFFKNYGINKNELVKRLEILSIILSLGDICYLLNRISLIKQGKINKLKQSSNRGLLIKKLIRILKKSNKKIERLR